MPDLQRDIPLSDNARRVMELRLLERGPDGKPSETVQEMYWRVAQLVAQAEAPEDVESVAEQFYDLLTSHRFLPNSPAHTGQQLAACFVLPLEDDLAAIFQTLHDAALVQQTGGGNGFAFSRLRPSGANVASSNRPASGPVSFLEVFDMASEKIAQGGRRRGANMAVVQVDHPDIHEFIVCKDDEGCIENFNISVALTDEFMQACQEDGEYDLTFDDEVYGTVRAREIFDLIVKQAHRNGEPGVLFIDTANRANPVPHLYEYETTNPCGEQWLGPNESCCLGSANLSRLITDKRGVDWQSLEDTIYTAVRFLDNVVTVNEYVPAVPQLKIAAQKTRRIGLGLTGLADMLYVLGIRYGSVVAQEFATQVAEFVRYHAMLASISLARERGPFPAYVGSVYEHDWTPPPPVVRGAYSSDWGRPALDWNLVVAGLAQHGIRNAAVMTCAPTGTMSTIADVEGYGCEPVIALAYTRHVDEGGEKITLQYTSPLFLRALHEAGLAGEVIQDIVAQVSITGSCQGVEAVPEDIQRVFVVSGDIHPEEHVRMQAALQVFIDNAISKTVNLPENATVDEVAGVFKLAWKLGCKGTTVYVRGSRDREVLTVAQPPEKKSRPDCLSGETYRIETPLGTTYVTINENGDGSPFEVFVHTEKGGSERGAAAEAFGRLMSLVLRLSSPVSPRRRVGEIARQLGGIGGGRPIGLGPNRVLSLPDGIAQVLLTHLGEPEKAAPQSADMCPDCGQAALLNAEGCRTCRDCGFSEC